MRRVLSFVAAGALLVGGFSLVGCESNNQSNLPPDEQGATAGGNGAFGENPARPGDYDYGQHANNSSAVTPSTQPSR